MEEDKKNKELQQEIDIEYSEDDDEILLGTEDIVEEEAEEEIEEEVEEEVERDIEEEAEEKVEKDLVEEVEETKRTILNHPMVDFYNYILQLQEQISVLKSNQDNLFLLIQQNRREDK